MLTSQNSLTQRNINNYLPAVLKENKSGWIIEYYVSHPQTGVLSRKQIKLERIISRYKKTSDARRHIAGMINSINLKLAGGWNPFFDNEDSRMFEKLKVVANLFIQNKKKELRENTIRSYESFVKNLIKWTDQYYSDIYASIFSQSQAVRYMDDLFSKEKIGVTTYNNHLKMGRALFNWMKERCYTKQNPFEKIRLKQKQKKKRVIIPKKTREEIKKHLRETDNIPFLLILNLIYTALIRPNELNQLKVKHVFLKEKYVLVPGEIAKNHKTRFASISQDIINLFSEIEIEKYPPEYHLFSSDLKPGESKSGHTRFGKEWIKLRKELELQDEMQLYSFRDTGIFDMLKSGIDDLSVMQHADHQSLDMTTIYANHHDPNLTNIIYTKSPSF